MSRISGNKILELLQRWLSGDTNRREEVQLEAQARKDEFLAEALEGYRRFPEAKHPERIEGLRNKIHTRSRKKRTLVFYLSRVAAALVFLAVIGAGIQYFASSPAGKTMALTSQEQKSAPHSSPKAESLSEETSPVFEADSEALAFNESAAGDSQGIIEEEKIIENQALDAVSSPVQSGALETVPPSIAEEPSLTYYSTEEKDMAVEEEAEQKEAVLPAEEERTEYYVDGISIENRKHKPDIAASQPEARPSINSPAPAKEAVVIADQVTSDDAAAQRIPDSTLSAKEASPGSPQPDLQQRNISGRVLDENREPLIGVNVFVPNSQTGTLTDVDGQFRLKVDTTAQQLGFTYTGYNTQQIPLDSSDEMEVLLNTDGMELSEVIVSSLGNKAKAKKRSKAQPSKGLKKYRKYISKNRRYPQAAQAAGIKGEVIVTFRIGPEGRPAQLRVLQSLGYGCDQEALRLIREGPDWEEIGQETTFSISFGKD